MTGQMITFPVRLYARGARALLHAAEDVTGRAVMSTLRVAGALSNLRPGAHREPPPPPRSAPRPATRPTPERSRNGAAPPPARSAPDPSPPSPEPLAGERLAQEGIVEPIDLSTPEPVVPEHVSQEPVVVREESEPGAQDGAGAAITVHEPWDGYARMNARDIVARLPACTSAELAATQLYESAHRNRQTIIAAVARELGRSGR